MFLYENLGRLLSGLFATGMAFHFVRRHHERRHYAALRAAYEVAVRAAQMSGADPAAIVDLSELHREFMRASFPAWFDGIGRRLLLMAKVCTALTLATLFLKAPLERRTELTRGTKAASAPGLQAGSRVLPVR